jgi:predicted enzyme related to lactoylglutathione lyase
MSDSKTPPIGEITWADLTVEDATSTRDFYSKVVGWNVTDVEMGGYNDFCMNEPTTGKTVAGICHARGMNAKLPAAWLIYINVDDLDKSIAACLELGGEIISPARDYGGQGRYCVIRDPAGAVAALFEPPRG